MAGLYSTGTDPAGKFSPVERIPAGLTSVMFTKKRNLVQTNCTLILVVDVRIAVDVTSFNCEAKIKGKLPQKRVPTEFAQIVLVPPGFEEDWMTSYRMDWNPNVATTSWPPALLIESAKEEPTLVKYMASPNLVIM